MCILKVFAHRFPRLLILVDLLLQGCQLTQFTEGYTDNLFAYASKVRGLRRQGGCSLLPDERLTPGGDHVLSRPVVDCTG